MTEIFDINKLANSATIPVHSNQILRNYLVENNRTVWITENHFMIEAIGFVDAISRKLFFEIMRYPKLGNFSLIMNGENLSQSLCIFIL